LLEHRSISVSDFRCTAAPGEKPFADQFGRHSVSYVRKGSFGCRGRRTFELVTGSVLVGFPGDEYVCTHEHICGDECLTFFLEPELVETIGDRHEARRVGAVPPLPELMVLGELAQAAARKRSAAFRGISARRTDARGASQMRTGCANHSIAIAGLRPLP